MAAVRKQPKKPEYYARWRAISGLMKTEYYTTLRGTIARVQRLREQGVVDVRWGKVGGILSAALRNV